jgi:hypothetical protein
MFDRFFIQQVLEGKKKTLDADTVKALSVPKFPELSTEWALQACMTDSKCWEFVPDRWAKKKAKRSKTFLMQVLHANRPDFLKVSVRNAEAKR